MTRIANWVSPLDEDEITRDGDRVRVPMVMMDGQRSKFHDGAGYPAGMKPGPIIPSDSTVADAKRDEAFDEYLADARLAWRARRGRKPSRFVKPRTTHDTADDAYDQRNDDLANAWKNPQ